MKPTIIILIITFFSSCITLKRDAKRIDRIYRSHPFLIEQICSINYNPIDSIKETIKYLPGKQIFITDTNFVTIDCDSVINNNLIPKILKVPCPPSALKIDTIEKTIETNTSNKALASLQKRSIDSLIKVLLKQKETSMKKEILQEAKITKKNKTILYLSIILGIGTIITIIKIYI